MSAALLTGFAVWAGLSMTWAPSAEKAFLELARVLLYLGLFLVAATLGVSGQGRFVGGGLALGIVGVGTIALLSRFTPDLVSPGPLADTIASARSRLSFPVDYWNGLAMLVGFSVPLLLSVAVTARGILLRSAAIAPLPAAAAVSYLASSRGGFLVIAVGFLLFLGLTNRRWSAAIAGAVGAAGAAAAVLMLAERPALVETPLSSAGRAEAGKAGLLLLGICILTGLTYGLVRAVPLRRSPPAALGWGTVVVVIALSAAAVVSAQPLERFEEFRRVPSSTPPTVEGHLLTLSSTGRWQQWEAAIDQFRSEPLHGGGAGSWGAWWLQHGEIRGFVSEAHSLYLEVLGELGLVGLALLAGALFIAFGSGAMAALRQRGELAGITAAAGGYLAGASIDWLWELTVVSVVGIVCLGLAASAYPTGGRRVASRGVRLGLAAAAVAALTLQSIPLLVHTKLRQSERAVARGDIRAAITAADAAAGVAPWATSPYLQLALVSETAGALPAAQRHLENALQRDSADWRLWLVAARFHVKQGNLAAAQNALSNARKLNPKSPLLAPPQ
ncbi:MAG: tetratricopeptide repeat protein [Solirubrobacterales bacterium]|nr:tetratricopeptide repeat protein [Solirubrobacterales bacterium]